MTGEASAASGTHLATRGQRLAGHIFEIVLFVLTLGVGWIFWFLSLARTGQTPAKKFLGLRVVGPDGQPASLRRMVVRDVVLKVLVFVVLDLLLLSMQVDGGFDLAFVGAFLWGVAAVSCLWDGNRQCLWDKVVGTRVEVA